jgi:hypothetical protein
MKFTGLAVVALLCAVLAAPPPLPHGALPPHTFRMGLQCARAAHWVSRFCHAAEVREGECASLLSRAQEACRKRGGANDDAASPLHAAPPLVIPVGLSPTLRIALHGDDAREHSFDVALDAPDAAAGALAAYARGLCAAPAPKLSDGDCALLVPHVVKRVREAREKRAGIAPLLLEVLEAAEESAEEAAGAAAGAAAEEEEEKEGGPVDPAGAAAEATAATAASATAAAAAAEGGAGAAGAAAGGASGGQLLHADVRRLMASGGGGGGGGGLMQPGVRVAAEDAAARDVRLKMCRHGLMLYPAREAIGQALEAFGEWDEQCVSLFGLLLERGQTVLDVGAHIGAYTLFFARAVGAAGRVVAMEPQRLVFQVLASDFSVF